MATTSNTYTGNGSNKLFSITFPYLDTTDIDVYLNGTLQTVTTQYTFANATTVEFVTAPGAGATVLLNRSTNDTTLAATFFSGSSIRASDLNENFDQVLYLAQETTNFPRTSISLGSATNPSFSFTGDPNTGIYSPGADQVALATNGTGRLFIDASGNVGVGTSNPNVLLHLNLSPGGTGPEGVIGFGDIGNFRVAEIEGLREGGSFAGSLIFRTQTSAGSGTAGLERLRIDSAGRVGIGTSAPGSKLEVGGEVSPRIGINSTGTTGTTGLLFQGAGTTYGSIIENVQSGELAIKSGASGQNSYFITFGTNDGTERARIDSSGRLLVGTSTSASAANPQYARLQVVGNTAGATEFGMVALLRSEAATSITTDEILGGVIFGDSSGNEFGRIFCEADGTAGAGDYPGRLVFSTTADGAASPTERMRIKSTGIVNIANTPTYADNAAATSGGLVAGDIYRKSDGTLMIRY